MFQVLEYTLTAGKKETANQKIYQQSPTCQGEGSVLEGDESVCSSNLLLTAREMNGDSQGLKLRQSTALCSNPSLR